MIRRWLIRMPCLLALTLVVGVWIVSYCCIPGVRVRASEHVCAIDVDTGVIFCRISPEPGPNVGPAFLFGSSMFPSGTPFAYKCAAFWIGRSSREPGLFIVFFPLWLPAAVLATLSWLVWRKARSKGAGRGFSVEPAAAKVQGVEGPPSGTRALEKG